MQLLQNENKNLTCALCGGTHAVKTLLLVDDCKGKPICAACRAKLLLLLAEDTAASFGVISKENAPDAAMVAGALGAVQAANAKSPEAEAMHAAALTMTEEAFEAKYLENDIDRILFEYVRGYGEADMEREGNAMVVLMMDGLAAEQEIVDRLAVLEARGILSPVAGKPGWYAADYTFAED